MPDLRKITRAQGLIRVLPIGAAAIGLNALLIVHLDADNRMVRRHFTLLTGWGQPIPTLLIDGSQSASDAFELTAAQPAVESSDEVDPITRLVFDAFFSGPRRNSPHVLGFLQPVRQRCAPIAPNHGGRPGTIACGGPARESTSWSSRRSVRRDGWSSSPVTRKS